MGKYTWNRQRKDIERQINSYFGRNIEISPRALAALQTYGHPEIDGLSSEYNIMHSLLRCSPACATLLMKAGANLEKLDPPCLTNSPGRLEPWTLDVLFRGGYGSNQERRRLSPTAEKIRERGILEELDLLTANLECAFFTDYDQEYTEFVDALLKSTDLKMPEYIRHSASDKGDEWERCDKYVGGIWHRVKELAQFDPSHSLIQFVLFEDDRSRIRIRPFGVTDISALSVSPPLKNGQQYVFRGGLLQPLQMGAPALSDDILGVFEELINSPSASEMDFQRFFEEHPFFLTGLDFRKAHPQPILYRDEGGPLIPDFFLEKMDGGWDTILDLKRAFDQMISRRPNRTYFKQQVHNAIAQLRYYREWFDSPINRKRFHDVYGVRTFKPKMVIVIGRRHHFRDDVERITLVDSLPAQVEIWTYDEVYQRAKRCLDLSRQIEL
jgi:hypothetical protein